MTRTRVITALLSVSYLLRQHQPRTNEEEKKILSVVQKVSKKCKHEECGAHLEIKIPFLLVQMIAFPVPLC